MPGAIIYRGPSELDRAVPIVVIAVWSSANRKTGDMLQTYVLRADMNPLEANKFGEDYAICGNCPHRGTPTLDPARKQAEQRTCYVTLGQGPLVVWNAFLAGKYPDATTPAARRAIGKGRKVRIGTYGDGAAAPFYVWSDLLTEADGHTAYSHNGGDPKIYMVSVDSIDEAKAAWRAGNRTFRVIPIGTSPAPQEIICPSIKGVHCADCMLCGGTSKQAKSIAIEVHGSGSKHF
jgi:hypothetical protein